jgi:asparagine synthase (glutamine-hydrolysing)
LGTNELPPERIQTCLRLMRRRGPDHAAFFQHSFAPGHQVYLLHSRLSIIDLDDRANQPFRLGAKVLVYNGELYNYLELRQELAARGHTFNTESDTEVLLRTLMEFGWQGLDKGEGMWAFASYDTSDGSLLLGRDRFGEKPLYLYRDSTGLYFGSEVKFIVGLLGHSLAINEAHLYRYLVNGYKSLYKVKDTFFQGVHELPPASVLRVAFPEQSQTQHRYWQPAFTPDNSLTYQDAVAGVRAALLRSVKLRLRADVPMAFCMSGGVDSNSLIGIAKNVFDYNVHGFTIANSDARYEEQDLVDYAVKELGIRHTSIPAGGVPLNRQGFLPKLRALVRQHDAPVYTITYFAHWLLMESIAEHGYRISVSGTAADELFTGYYDHHLAYLYEIQEEPELYAASRQAWTEQVRPLVRNPYLANPDAFVKNPGLREHIFFNADGFAQYLTVDWAEPFSEQHYTHSLLRNRMLNEMFHEAVPVILHEDDLNAMYFSIENRSPYLDRELFEFCYRIPSRYLIQGGLAKAVLRQAMRGIVPARILDNPRKVGFNAPIFSFLDPQDPQVRSYLLDRSPIYNHVRRNKIEALLTTDKGSAPRTDLPNSESKFLFYFLSSKIFLEEFAAGG